MNKIQLRRTMRACPQTSTQNVLQHGISVARFFKDLHDHITKGSELTREWRLPDWIYDERLWCECMDVKTLITYHIYHDCGKPFCREVDDCGKQHFPNHATVSAAKWKEVGGSDIVGRLIGMDMDAHLINKDTAQEFISRREAASLIITALCEIHSNAEMFGGIDSTSFKIKWKKLNKLGKRFLENRKR